MIIENVPDLPKPTAFSNHAQEKMAKRKISWEDFMDTLFNPQKDVIIAIKNDEHIKRRGKKCTVVIRPQLDKKKEVKSYCIVTVYK